MKKVLDYVLKDREMVFSCSRCGCIYVAGEEDYDILGAILNTRQ